MKDVWLRVSSPPGTAPMVFALVFDDGILSTAAPCFRGRRVRGWRWGRDGRQIVRGLRGGSWRVEALSQQPPNEGE